MIKNELTYVNYKNIIFKSSFLIIFLIGFFLIGNSVLAADAEYKCICVNPTTKQRTEKIYTSEGNHSPKAKTLCNLFCLNTASTIYYWDILTSTTGSYDCLCKNETYKSVSTVSECNTFCLGDTFVNYCKPFSVTNARPDLQTRTSVTPVVAKPLETTFKPQIGIPGSEFQTGVGVAIGNDSKNAKGDAVKRSDLMARYVSAFYNWGMTIVGAIAVLMLMAAGLLWLTSGGDSERINQAKKLISNSLLGSGLLIGSWFLLNIINPNLTSLPVIETIVVQNIKQDKLVCCDQTTGAVETLIKIEKGKKIATEGVNKGKEIRCGSTSSECTKGDICTISGAEEKYACKPDLVCCSCWWTSITFPISVCQDNITRETCINFCTEKESILRSTVTYFAASAESHKCKYNWAGFTGDYCGLK